MGKDILGTIKKNIEKEPYVKLFGMKVLELRQGYSKVQMKAKKEHLNLHLTTHGGAIFSLVDVAFGSAANSYGNIAVALNIDINYIRPSNPGDILTAEATEVSRGRTVGTYNILVKNGQGKIVASSQAIAFIKKEKLPFVSD
ncbi:MAG: PaaI family thioesterase, partial [Actinobacteria bacterium]|nr:PaaI family thioesterase [Actinomycetota bacterium]